MLKAREVIRVLENLDIKSLGKKPIPVPVHGSQDSGRRLLKIIWDLQISREEFLRLLRD